MEPRYMIENRYTYQVGSWRRAASAPYATETPENTFQDHLQDLVATGQTHLQHEEFARALQQFQEAMAIILHTVHPDTPVDPHQVGSVPFPLDPRLLDPLIAKTATILVKTAPPRYAFPASVVSERSMLSAEAARLVAPIAERGLKVTSFHRDVERQVTAGLEAAEGGDWKGAVALYQAALEQTPATEPTIRGALLHDLAVLSEKADDRAKAQELGRASVEAFERGGVAEAQAQALATTAGIIARAGNARQATTLTRRLNTLKTTIPVKPVAGRPAFTLEPSAPELIGTRFVAEAVPQKTLTITGATASATLALDATAVASTRQFLTTLSRTEDIALLTSWQAPAHFAPFIPGMYFYVLPMSIGDCYTGMGNLELARDSYASALGYPFINEQCEVAKLWLRLAQTHLALGDRAYRNARDDAAAFAGARTWYETIVRADRTVDATSPLYADSKFDDIESRVTAVLAAPDPVQVAENPAIVTVVLDALAKLAQIDAGLNFFGLGPDYVPPFGFEYLQNTARYFAQQASQTEQRYIQYKSQAENEEFRREQLDQQAEVARQTVILEERGVVEAQRGVDVASAGVRYAVVQEQNAVAAQTEFNNTRWELLELSHLEAWASASAVDRDDQVKLTISGYRYYQADSKRRNVVLQELAAKRTRLSQDLQAAQLGRAVVAAQASRAVAQAQLGQAQARVAVTQQRVKIAQLQQRQAEENRDFLDMREFSAGLWYELAAQARRLKQRYLDMATEMAILMERAYQAETERGLRVIRFDYESTSSGNLMGADLLLADVDSFTVDHVTTTKTKKMPVKKTISLADAYPMPFHALQAGGRCTFQTRLEDFDREHPGLYLAKIRNVEVVFVGLTGQRGIAGTLRNIGVSRFRTASGAVVDRLYPADVMVLSQYEIRQDSLAFRFSPNDLRLFENNGIETLWQLDLPRDANDFDYGDILDVHLVIYYDGFFDPILEDRVRAALPTSGAASRAVSLKLAALDELFYLKNQGEAEVVFDATMFPRNQRDLARRANMIKLGGRPQTIAGLTLRLASTALGSELVLTSDARGEVLDAALLPLRGLPVLDRWRVTVTAADNPQLVQHGALDLSGLDDLMIFFEYEFGYR
jgi:hypothetical protein